MFSSPKIVTVVIQSFFYLTCSFVHQAIAADSIATPTGYYGVGNVPSATEIAGWNIDVSPDGKGLPPGQGTVETGEMIYDEKCSLCHGSFGEGVDGFPVLAGGEGSLTDTRPIRTVGSYWRYTSTLWDYVNRTMPFNEPESLNVNEVYALVAYVLYLNDLVDDEFTLNQQNLTHIRLPNELNFISDPRPDVANARCMNNCKNSEEVVIASSVVASVTEEKPLEVTSPEMPVVGQDTYDRYCALCHKSGLGGAPIVGREDDWIDRLPSGIVKMTQNAIDGFSGSSGIMPAKGGFVSLTETEVGNAVKYMMSRRH